MIAMRQSRIPTIPATIYNPLKPTGRESIILSALFLYASISITQHTKTNRPKRLRLLRLRSSAKMDEDPVARKRKGKFILIKTSESANYLYRKVKLNDW